MTTWLLIFAVIVFVFCLFLGWMPLLAMFALLKGIFISLT